MENIYNKELIEIIFNRIPDIKVIENDSRLILSHHHNDWDFITILSQRLGFVAERWMQNQEPRTTIYNKI